MTRDRFERPRPGAPAKVHFPHVRRRRLDTGLGVWSIARPGAQVVNAVLVIDGGSSADPADRPGLASLVADLTDEGAGGRDSIALADALSRLGATFDIEVAPDVTTVSLSAIARQFEAAAAILADIVVRPHLAQEDFDRIIDLRTSRLRQLSQSPAAAADRAILAAMYGTHPYGHGTVGTSASLRAMTLDQARAFWSGAYGAARSTLVVVGDLGESDVDRVVDHVFGRWTGAAGAASPIARPATSSDARILVVDRPGAPQSELRIGHTGPARKDPDYHALVTLNALLGGQFTSRINRNLRETRAITYGARTQLDLRRAGGAFVCDTSVQGDATAVAVADVLAEYRTVQQPGEVTREELSVAQASLTRGYVRNFETAGQLARAAAQLVVHGLPEDTFDRFVPGVEAVTITDVARVAHAVLRPDDASVVVVGDSERSRGALAELGRTVEVTAPEF